MGGGLGHIGPLAQLGACFKKQGHDAVFALRDVASAETFLGPQGLRYLAAPFWQGGHRAAPAVPVSYPEILLGSGYHDEAPLLSLVKAWRALYELVAPDVILFDFAPTALLAARGIDIPRVIVGTGFHTPPPKSPCPPFRTDMPIAPDRWVNNEKTVLENVNRVLRKLGQPPLGVLHELFDVEENFLSVLPELDHYPDRVNGNYCGPIFSHVAGVSPDWQGRTKQKVFAYLKPSYPHFEPLIRRLHATACETLIHAPGLSPSFVERYSRDNVRFSQDPIKIDEVAHSCDAAVCHGGTLTSALLLAGKPLLLLPMHAEQMVTARLAENMGVAKAAFQPGPDVDFASLIESLLTQDRWRDAAQAFARKHEGISVERTITTVANRCAALAGKRLR